MGISYCTSKVNSQFAVKGDAPIKVIQVPFPHGSGKGIQTKNSVLEQESQEMTIALSFLLNTFL
jgi:hypothetical protein